MKKAEIVWNILLAALGLYGVFVRWDPMVYEQAHYQFTNPRGDSSMWPATFEGGLFLIAFLGCLVALSSLFNRKLGVVARTIAGALTALLLLGWAVSADLWIRGGMPGSLLARMCNFEGFAFITVAVISFGIVAAVGLGPVTLGAKWLRGISFRKAGNNCLHSAVWW